jgi:4-hydroxymandelate oxidase
MAANDDKLLTVGDYRRAAREKLSRMAHDYFRSGADAEVSLRANRRAFVARRLLPRVLVDVSAVDCATVLLGRRHPSPLFIAPTAYQRLAHPEGERATARAAAASGTLYCVSMLATTSLEDVAAVGAGPRWFQLYVHKDRGLTRSLVERARAAGYEALVVTVDTPILGRRVRDERNGFALPDGLEMANLVASAPLEARESGSALASYAAARHDTRLSWSDLEWLRSLATPLPLVLKGILRADDARRAIDAGAAGIIVSNHGGRQLDGVPATLEVLPEIVAAVGGRADVMLDGGVRWGTDVLKALALGARAVGVGRPILWGLAVDGEAGVAHVLSLLREELLRAMALCGAPSLAALTADLVR